jgi:hypothetical protein
MRLVGPLVVFSSLPKRYFRKDQRFLQAKEEFRFRVTDSCQTVEDLEQPLDILTIFI